MHIRIVLAASIHEDLYSMTFALQVEVEYQEQRLKRAPAFALTDDKSLSMSTSLNMSILFFESASLPKIGA